MTLPPLTRKQLIDMTECLEALTEAICSNRPIVEEPSDELLALKGQFNAGIWSLVRDLEVELNYGRKIDKASLQEVARKLAEAGML